MSEARIIVYGQDDDGNLRPLSVSGGGGGGGGLNINIAEIGGEEVGTDSQGIGFALPVVESFWQNYTGNFSDWQIQRKAGPCEFKTIAPGTGISGTQNGPSTQNFGWSQLICAINVVSVGTSLTAKIQGSFGGIPATAYYDILTSAAIVGPGVTYLRVSPYLTAAPNLIAQDILPPVFRVILTASGGNAVAGATFLLTGG